MLPHPQDRRCRVAYFTINLARRWVGFNHGTDQRRERFAAATNQFHDQQPRNHATVAVKEIAKIMVGTHLTAIHCIFAAHALLNKRMARLGLNSFTTTLLNHLNSIPG